MGYYSQGVTWKKELEFIETGLIWIICLSIMPAAMVLIKLSVQ